jgi:hypothetical protein
LDFQDHSPKHLLAKITSILSFAASSQKLRTGYQSNCGGALHTPQLCCVGASPQFDLKICRIFNKRKLRTRKSKVRKVGYRLYALAFHNLDHLFCRLVKLVDQSIYLAQGGDQPLYPSSLALAKAALDSDVLPSNSKVMPLLFQAMAYLGFSLITSS